jgi:CBS domain containing-hemolysin-like protein
LQPTDFLSPLNSLSWPSSEAESHNWPPWAAPTLRRSRAVDNLDANLTATQLDITISSLALGWIGEPALAHLIEPLFGGFTGPIVAASSHTAAIAISFVIITVLQA